MRYNNLKWWSWVISYLLQCNRYLQRHHKHQHISISSYFGDIDRLKKLKWQSINPVSIEIWNNCTSLNIFNIEQYFSYVVAVSYIGGGSRRSQRKPLTYRK
jgi:hypothetical protein